MGFNTPTEEQAGRARAGRWGSPHQLDTAVPFPLQVFPEGFLPRCEKQLILPSLLNLSGSLVDRAPVKEKLSQSQQMDMVLEWVEAA